MGTVTPLPVISRQDTPCPCPDLVLFCEMLRKDGTTPEEVASWDPHRTDPFRRDQATELLADTLAWVSGRQSPVEVLLDAHTAKACAAILAASAP